MWTLNDLPPLSITALTLALAWIVYTRLFRKSKPDLPLCTPVGQLSSMKTRAVVPISNVARKLLAMGPRPCRAFRAA